MAPRTPVSRTFGMGEVLRMIPGVSYRNLDYWCRAGWITVEWDATGSGSRRRFTGPEVEALSTLVTEYRRLQAGLARISSGEFFADQLQRDDEAAA